MTTEFLLDEIKAEEGRRLNAYPDPISHGAPWTIGYGHTGPEVHEGLVWDQDQCDTALAEDVQKATHLLDANIPWWRTQEHVRQDVLADMVFNMGWGNGSSGLSGFHHFLNYVRTGQYDAAADAMLQSHWAAQVGKRATRLSVMMRTGARQTIQ